MSHRPLLLIGLIAGATALQSASPPAHADSSRDNSRLRSESRSNDRSSHSNDRSSRSNDRPSPSSSGNSGRLFGSSSGRGESRSGSPFANSPNRANSPGLRSASPGTFENRLRPTSSNSFENRNPLENRNPFSRGGDSRLDVFQRNSSRNQPSNAAGNTSIPTRTDGPFTPRSGGASLPDLGSPGYSHSGRQYNRNSGGSIGRRNSDPAPQTTSSESPRHDNPGSALGGRNSQSYRPGSSRRGYDRSNEGRHNPFFNEDGVTNAGRVLGTNRPMDEHGRTAIGRALGAPIDRASVHYRRPPVYGYNPRNGRYESFDSGRSRWSISVLFGTAASSPTYRFRYHSNRYGLYYYPYYCADTFGLSIGSYYQSPYFYYGSFLPLYIPSTRVVVVDRPVVIHDDDY
jgi:hypothetical protein